MRTYKRKVGSRSYKSSYTTEALQKAVKEIQEGKISLRKAHKQYKIPLGTLSHRVARKHGRKVGHPTVFTADEEKAFVDHINVVASWGFPFDAFDVRILVKTYLEKQGKVVKQFANNIPSADFVRSFLFRHKEQLSLRRCQNIKRTRASVSAAEVKEYFSNLKETLDNGGEPIRKENIFNYDETNLSDNPGTKKCIYKRGVKYPERIKDSTKSAISVMFCGSASGDMLPAYVVYKAENLWSTWTEGGPKGTRYNRSRSGWFDACCFNDWFETLFVRHARNLPGKKVLIGDNLSSHFTPTVLQLAAEYDILFVCLPPNATHLLQPLDVAFYRALKGYWRKVNRSCVFAEFCQQLFVRLIIPFQNCQDNIYKIVLTISTFI